MTTHYTIRPADLGRHTFSVTVRIDAPDPLGQHFFLPAWIPGSYMIRDFARNVLRVHAQDGRNRSVPIEKIDKHTWRCLPDALPGALPGAPTDVPTDAPTARRRSPARAASLTLTYEVYAHDLSVRAAHLDTTHGFFNGSSVFLLPLGREKDDCEVEIVAPATPAAHDWHLATALEPCAGTARGRFGRYRARNYEELIDAPVEMGRFVSAQFAVHGVPHEIAVTSAGPNLDPARLASDLARVCATHARMFEPRTRTPPFGHYAFLTFAVDEGYGGLEHRASTALLCRRDDLPHVGMQAATDGYRRFLGLASHEYFHAWHVKRIRPAAFIPYDLTRENHTSLLWVFEGFTSYYDDLALVRCGLIDPQQYLDTIARTMASVLQRSGRHQQSLAESSFDAWIKYYKPDENTPNAVVSYYQKGALVALGLDLSIRHETAGRRSLDDVMRHLWRRYKRTIADYPGVAEDAIAAIVLAATGVDAAARIRAWTQETEDPELAALLPKFGVRVEARPVLDPPHYARLGCRIDPADGRIRLVFDGGPAQRAGLSAGDQIVAIDGLRAGNRQFDVRLARIPPESDVEILAFRRDELLRFSTRLATQPPTEWKLSLDVHASATARRLRRGWVGS